MNQCRDCEDYSIGLGSGQCPRCQAQDQVENSAREFSADCDKATRILGEAIFGPSKHGWMPATPLQLAQAGVTAIEARNETIEQLRKENQELKARLDSATQ